MIKAIAKLFMPGAATLSGYAADGIRKAVNESRDETRHKVAKVATIAKTATDIGGRLAAMVDDGTIDQLERDEIAAMLRPVFERVLELV